MMTLKRLETANEIFLWPVDDMMLEAHLTCTNVQSQYQQALDNLFQRVGETHLSVVKSCAMETQTNCFSSRWETAS